MNNKGFTLVELLAVILILSAMSLIVAGSITTSLVNREEKECEEQKELAKNAAKIYFSLNDETSVTVQKLEQSGFFSADKKADRLDKNSVIRYNSDGYQFDGDCLDS